MLLYLLRLHCHRKPSQNGIMLKIALCWPSTSIYTAIIIMVRALGCPVMHHMILIHHGSGFMVSAKEMHRKTQKHTVPSSLRCVLFPVRRCQAGVEPAQLGIFSPTSVNDIKSNLCCSRHTTVPSAKHVRFSPKMWDSGVMIV